MYARLSDPNYDEAFLAHCMSKVTIDQNGCWLWNGTKDRKGYGQVGYRGRSKKVHRTFYAVKVGPIPDGLCVCHKCDVPACINPDHMFLGTVRDNLRDMAAKGRHKEQRKTHCPKNHEYTPENTYLFQGRAGPERICRACKKAADDRKVARIKRREAPQRYRNNAALITVDGETRTAAEWAAHLGMSPSAISIRLRKGCWRGVAMVTPPPPGRRQLKHF